MLFCYITLAAVSYYYKILFRSPKIQRSYLRFTEYFLGLQETYNIFQRGFAKILISDKNMHLPLVYLQCLLTSSCCFSFFPLHPIQKGRRYEFAKFLQNLECTLSHLLQNCTRICFFFVFRFSIPSTVFASRKVENSRLYVIYLDQKTALVLSEALFHVI